MIPPLSMWLHIEAPGRRSMRMWLPLFLVWLILLPILALALVITAVVDIVLYLAGEKYHHYTLLLARCLEVLAETRGTVVRVHGDRTIVDVAIS